MKTKRIALSIALGLALSACAPQEEIVSSESSLSINSSSVNLPQESTVSETSVDSSSGEPVYYTILIMEIINDTNPYLMGVSGPQWRGNFKVEAGKPIYSTVEEAQDFLFNKVGIFYVGTCTVYGLFCNEECTIRYEIGDPVTVDESLYYFYIIYN